MDEFINDLIDSLRDLRIDNVVKELNSLFTMANPDLQTVLIIIDANRNRLTRHHLAGIISYDQYIQEHNKIIDKLLKLIEEIKTRINQYLPFFLGNKLKKIENQKDIILFLGANPGRFDIDIRKEVEQISSRLALMKKRDSFEFKVKLDVTPLDIQRSLLEMEKEPRFFHFGGNSIINDPNYGTGIVLAGKTPDEIKVVKGDVLSSIFSRANELECVFLNSCNTMPYAIDISEHIPYVVAMNQYTTDKFAIDFASHFYEAIGAGKDIKYSFDYSIDALRLQDEYKKEQIDTPQLLEKGKKYSFKWYNETREEWRARVKPG